MNLGFENLNFIVPKALSYATQERPVGAESPSWLFVLPAYTHHQVFCL